ncbi:MAG: arylesterase [Methylocella sp.]
MSSKTNHKTASRQARLPATLQPARSGYKDRRGFLQAGAGLLAFVLLQAETLAAETPHVTRLIAFGDSLSAGYLLPADAAFPAALEQALRKEGYKVTVVNAGVSGDTSSDGLARLDWALAEGADGVILELGANDMLRGIDPDVTNANLAAILEKLKSRNIKVLFAGMLASPSLGKDYKAKFDALFPALATQYDAPLYPFFLEGVAGQPKLTLSDGLHPSAAGVETIVQNILPSVRNLLAEMGHKSGGGN